MNIDVGNIAPFVILAFFVGAAIIKQMRKLGSGFNAVVEQQRGAALRAAEAAMQAAEAQGASANASRSDVAAVLKAAVAAYEAAPAYSATVTAPAPAYQPAHKHKQHKPAAVRPVPVARSVDVPVAAAPLDRWVIADAFRTPAHARVAFVMAEILGPPRALR